MDGWKRGDKDSEIVDRDSLIDGGKYNKIHMGTWS